MWVYSHAAFNFMLEIDYMFYSDRPINSGNEDKLNRKGFARLLARTLVNLDSKDTFTVGLFGKWGCGKTSLVNMLLGKCTPPSLAISALGISPCFQRVVIFCDFVSIPLWRVVVSLSQDKSSQL